VYACVDPFAGGCHPRSDGSSHAAQDIGPATSALFNHYFDACVINLVLPSQRLLPSSLSRRFGGTSVRVIRSACFLIQAVAGLLSYKMAPSKADRFGPRQRATCWMGAMGDVLLTTLGTLGLVVAAVALTARYLPGVNRPLVVTAALAPYLMLGAPLAVLLFASVRAWPVVALAGALTIATAAVQLPWHVATKHHGSSTVRVVSANLWYGRAEPTALLHLAVQHADILAVQELTPKLADRISAAGIDKAFPYHALRAREGPAGVGIWSRYPLRHGGEYDEFWLGLLVAHVRIPDVPADVTIVAAHMSSPEVDLQGWRTDLTRLGDTLRDIGASAAGPVMLAADLNATPDHLEFRRLLSDGYRDAAEQAGAGLTRTYPAVHRWLPTLFALDHILTRNCTAAAVQTLDVTGSDHHALAADIAL
jgi:endonuclease/exonuclease/phosphatase (EEP) superfamily protein YafD